MGDLTLFKALTGGAFDRLNWQHSGEFDQNFSKKSNAPGGMGGFGIDRYITFNVYITRRIFAFTRALCWGETLVLLHVVSQGFFCNDGLSCNCFCIGMLEMQGYYLCIQVTLL